MAAKSCSAYVDLLLRPALSSDDCKETLYRTEADINETGALETQQRLSLHCAELNVRRTIDSIVWEDLKNKLRAVVVMGTYKPAGYFSGKKSGSKSSFMGSIYHLKDSALKPTVFGRNQKLPTDLSKLSTEIKTKISDIEGNWLTHLNVNKKQIWTIEGHKVTRPIN